MYSNFGRLPGPGAIIALIVSFAITSASADSRLPLTLAEAEDIALRDEPGLTELRANAEALEDRAIAAGQLPDPTLRIGIANYPINHGSFSTEGMTQAQLGIRQSFPRRRLRSTSSAEYDALAAVQFNNANARTRHVLEVTRAGWLESYFWQRAEQVLTESRPLFIELLQVTQSLYAVGRKTQSDVLRAELELRRLDDRLIEASRSMSGAQGALSQWLGDDAFRTIAVKLPDWEPPSIETLRENLASHPTLQAAESEIAARQAKIGIAEEKGKPGWALDLGYGYRDGFLPSGEPRSDFISLSVQVDLPIFKKKRQDRDLAAALSGRRAAVSGKRRIAADLSADLNTEYAQWTDLTRRLALYEIDILDLSRNQAEAAMLAYQSDAGNFSDVMLSQIDVLNTRLEYIRIQVERARIYAALANLGGLSR